MVEPQKMTIDSPCSSVSKENFGCKVPPNPDWISAGWVQRFVADERMLKDSITTYEELGYEIRTEVFSPQQVPEVCQGCQLSLVRFRVIYTRKKN